MLLFAASVVALIAVLSNVRNLSWWLVLAFVLGLRRQDLAGFLRQLYNASPNPIRRARFWRLAGNRPANIVMNTRLSMPSTISSAVSVKRLAQICGSFSQPISVFSKLDSATTLDQPPSRPRSTAADLGWRRK